VDLECGFALVENSKLPPATSIHTIRKHNNLALQALPCFVTAVRMQLAGYLTHQIGTDFQI